jgi:hypothetical protein
MEGEVWLEERKIVFRKTWVSGPVKGRVNLYTGTLSKEGISGKFELSAKGESSAASDGDWGKFTLSKAPPFPPPPKIGHHKKA